MDRTKLFCQCFIIHYPGSVWPGLDLLVWHAMCNSHGQTHCVVEDDFSLSHVNTLITCLWRTRDKLKTYLQYHSAYGHQTLQDGDLEWLPPITVRSTDIMTRNKFITKWNLAHVFTMVLEVISQNSAKIHRREFCFIAFLNYEQNLPKKLPF